MTTVVIGPGSVSKLWASGQRLMVRAGLIAVLAIASDGRKSVGNFEDSKIFLALKSF